MSGALALDLGGTNLRAALVREDGKILHRLATSTPLGKDSITGTMISMRRELIAVAEVQQLRVRGIGVSTGGRVNYDDGVVLDSTALLPGWRDVPVRELLHREFGLPVMVDNDGNSTDRGNTRTSALAACSILS